eukprot:m.17949 g.17949  ORF g.17949 m.17949 type:complete len:190 (+) comp7621_c0_seq1:1612-2181(+)
MNKHKPPAYLIQETPYSRQSVSQSGTRKKFHATKVWNIVAAKGASTCVYFNRGKQEASRLSNKSACGGALVLEVWSDDAVLSVVAGKTVNTALDKNEAELAVLVLAVAHEMLAHSDGLLDEMVKVLWELWCETLCLEDAEDLGTCEALDLSNTAGITKDNTDLGWGETLACELVNLLLHVICGVEVAQP